MIFLQGYNVVYFFKELLLQIEAEIFLCKS